MDKQELSGGRKGAIFKHGETVIRPLTQWSKSVHCFLDYLARNGFDAGPKVIEATDSSETLSYVVGDVYNYPLVGAIASDQALTSAGQLLRRFHDVSALFVSENRAQNLEWMLPSRTPEEVIVHGDFSPYNVALKENQVTGVFDFDTAHPAPRLWDLAYAVYCWAPFKTGSNDSLGNIDSQSHRAKLFCDAYGATPQQCEGLVEAMKERLDALVGYMHSQAEQGNTAFIDNLADGHHLSYLRDIEYLSTHAEYITSVLVSPSRS
ncbi:phosphotransferase enzyme family protein [Vibrio paucivorans]